MNWKEIFIEYAKTKEHILMVEEAKEIIQESLKKPCYLSFSGGKDSTCMLYLARKINPEIPVYHFDFGDPFMPRDWLENIKEIAQYKLNIIEMGDISQSEFIKKQIPNIMKPYKHCLIGLRKQEGIGRKLRIQNNRSLTDIKEFWPLQNWTWIDIWSYIFSNNIPYHKYYHQNIDVLGYNKIRFSTLFDKELEKLGTSNIDGVLSWKYRNKQPCK